MKWIVRIAGLIGLGWGALSALYALGVVMLAPLAVRVDSAEFRNSLVWLCGVLIFFTAYLFIYIIHLILNRSNFRLGALAAATIGIIILLYGIFLMDFGFGAELVRFAALQYVVPLIGWLITVLYLNWPRKNIELTLG